VIVLDASALLAFLKQEPGWEKVKALLATATMSTLNLAEALSKLAEVGADIDALARTLVQSKLTFVEFSAAHALAAARLRPLTRSAGLSIGDRACLALGLDFGCSVLTTDASWQRVSVGVTVEMLR
jgi:PIN domain nuclease of toxin-antitoxin system